MGVFKNDEIAGYALGEEYVCTDCVKDDEAEAVIQNMLITEKDIGNVQRYFCDRCGKEIC